ncbi:uncharacterized protein LOC114522430 [Dendronephthya gigantea]|uniref:uncharacterized protein LOC114522430 n=1 Tax=Dendronephthya gigantea TaxID=151771 RepID=UPI00106DCDFA|nr:uncharacterized protein LOC114522430 [Dendronephthya gigantea]
MACSKKNWAYTFIGFGIAFLVIGIVVGFVIPKIVIGIVEDKVCVDSFSDSNYGDWKKEQPDRVLTKLYYWQITNKDDFLYNGKYPNLEERGPYVYKQAAEKINVSFGENKRSSKTWMKKAKFFKEESCDDCEEDDKITILNAGYLGLMKKFGGDQGFAMFSLPGSISFILQQFNYSFEELGNTRNTSWNDPTQSGWKNPGFGAWIHAMQPKYNTSTNFTSSEMKGLYEVLRNKSLLFGETDTNATLKKDCEGNRNPVQEKCGFLAQMTAMTNTTKTKLSGLNGLISSTLCLNAATQCFNRTNLFRAILPYIQHVSKFTMWLLVGSRSYELVTTRSQKDIALGYTMEIGPEKIPIPGIVRGYDNESEAEKVAKTETFYTCEAGDSKKHQWAEFDGKSSVSGIPGISEKDATVKGYSQTVPRSETADKPCAFSHELPFKKLELFASQLGLGVELQYTSEASLHGLDLKRFTPHKDTFLNNSGVHEGYIYYSLGQGGVPVYVSLAHRLYAKKDYPLSFNQSPKAAKHESMADVEPVTGITIRGLMRLQMNAAIKSNMVTVERIRGALNISFLAEENDVLYRKSIPVLWGEYGGQATKDDIDDIKKQVIGTLGLACGVLIAVPVLGGIFIIVAVVLLVITAKANQISEMSK